MTLNPVIPQSQKEVAKLLASQNRHTFNVCDKSGTKKADLVKSFLSVIEVSCMDKVLYTINKNTQKQQQWTLYKEASLNEAFKKQDTIKCIVSFQTYKDGEMFAVARVWKEKITKPFKKQENQQQSTGA